MYHFSSLRRNAAGQWQSQAFPITDQRLVRDLYAPYFRSVDAMARQLRAQGIVCEAPDPVVQVQEPAA